MTAMNSAGACRPMRYCNDTSSMPCFNRPTRLCMSYRVATSGGKKRDAPQRHRLCPSTGALAPAHVRNGRADNGCGRGSKPPAVGEGSGPAYNPRKMFDILDTFCRTFSQKINYSENVQNIFHSRLCYVHPTRGNTNVKASIR